jgi:hypothetical protein
MPHAPYKDRPLLKATSYTRPGHGEVSSNSATRKNKKQMEALRQEESWECKFYSSGRLDVPVRAVSSGGFPNSDSGEFALSYAILS